MRPFKFFFTVSVGLILFFFLARVFLFAMMIAAVMSVLFFIAQKTKNFFRRLSWEDDSYRYGSHHNYRFEEAPYRMEKRGWKFDRELLVDDWEVSQERLFAEKIIPVR